MSDAQSPTLGLCRFGLRCTRLAGHILVCIAAMLTLPLLGRRIDALTRWWYRRLLRIMNVRVTVHGRPPERAALAVANHISWVDIILLGGLLYPAFVSKAEVGNWPVIGRFARATGTVFLTRGAFRTNAAAQRLRQVLDNGRSVLLFPEATTNAQLMPNRFHGRLFAAAIDGNHPVQPVALRYLPDDPASAGHHPLAPWVDEANLANHFLRLLRLEGITVEVTYCRPIDPAGRDRRTLADTSHTAIATALAPGKPAAKVRAG